MALHPPSRIALTHSCRLVIQLLLEYPQGQETHYHTGEYLSALESPAWLKGNINICTKFPNLILPLELEPAGPRGWGKRGEDARLGWRTQSQGGS